MDSTRIRDALSHVVRHFADNPGKGLVTDKAAVATVQGGLVCRAEGPNGAVLVTDMPTGVGGTDSAPTPGWFLRAALANCDATMIAMRAAQLGVALTRLQVTVDSVSNNRGMFGIAPDIHPGPQEMRVRVEIASADASADELRDIVHWAERHSPVGDAVRRAVPTSVEIDTP